MRMYLTCYRFVAVLALAPLNVSAQTIIQYLGANNPVNEGFALTDASNAQLTRMALF